MSLQDIVNVTITSQSAQVTQAGFGTPLILGVAAPLGSDRVRAYASLSALAGDGFKPADLEYKAAAAVFSQNPRPPLLKIGRRSAVVQGQPPTPIATDLDTIQQVDGDWYALLTTSSAAADIAATAAWVEPNEKLYLATSADADLLTSAASDIATALKSAGYARTAVIYHPDPTVFADAAWAGCCLSLDPGSETWKFRTLAGVPVTKPTDTQLLNLRKKNCNTYTLVGGLNITAEGAVAVGEFIDVVRGRDWLKARLQEDIFSLLANAKNKVPFTDGGVGRIKARVLARLRNAVGVGFLAEDPPPAVNAPQVADVPVTDRAARHLPGMTFSGTLAGAVHSLDLSGVISV